MSVFKHGKYYWFEFVFRGIRIRRSTRQGDKEVAKSLEANERTRLAQNAAGIRIRPPAPTLRDFSHRFLAHVNSGTVKESTAEFYESKLSRLLKFPPLADSSLDSIDEAAIENYVQFRRRLVDSATINRELATLRKLMRHAYGEKRVDRLPKFRLLRENGGREFVLSHEQEQIYLEFAPQPLRDFALLMLDTGFRPGEALSLEWRDVHLPGDGDAWAGWIHIERGKTKKARRDISLTERAATMLKGRKSSSSAKWVFTDPAGVGPLSRYSLKDQHDRTRKALQLPKEFVLYSLRHTFGTRIVESGTEPFAVMRIMGHSTVTISQKYVHTSGETVERAIRRLDAMNKSSRREAADGSRGELPPPKVPPVKKRRGSSVGKRLN